MREREAPRCEHKQVHSARRVATRLARTSDGVGVTLASVGGMLARAFGGIFWRRDRIIENNAGGGWRE